MKTSLRIKVTAIVLFLVTPLFVFLYYTNIYAINIVKEKVSNSASDTLELHLGGIDEILEQTRKYVLRTANESTVLDLYSDSPADSIDHFLSVRKLMDQWYNDVSYYTVIRSVFVYNPSRDEIFLGTQKDYYKEMDNIRSVLPKQLGNHNRFPSLNWDIIDVGGEPVLFKILPDKSGRLYVAVLVGIDTLVKPLSQLEAAGGDERVGIISGNGKLLWGDYKEADLKEIRAHMNNQTTNSKSSIKLSNGRTYLFVGKPSHLSDMDIFIMLDEQSLLAELPFFQRAIKWIPVVVVLIMIILFMLLSQLIFKPINLLVNGMRKLGKGQLDYRMAEAYSKEFRMITQQFNQMAGQIQDLKINVYEESLRVQQAELKHLQAQINPHFFLNSLNIVYHLVELQKYPLIQKMVNHLVTYFRFIMNTNEKWIVHAREVEHIQTYMEIQKLMYPDRIRLSINIPDHLSEILIPPFLIQPFVENAMKHGFKNNRVIFELKVVALTFEKDGMAYLCITISDTGPGFSEEQLMRLNYGDDSHEPTDRQLGIWNVRRRLDMFYSGKASLAFRQDPALGAVVELLLPML